MRIAIANDHAAVDMKNMLIDYLKEKGHTIINLGTDTKESYDYPLAGARLGLYVREGKADIGIGICGTGIGISLACNKIRGIRAACCSDTFSAAMAREHNNANILCFGARVIGDETAKTLVDAFLNAKFQGGKHARRVSMVMDIETRETKY